VRRIGLVIVLALAGLSGIAQAQGKRETYIELQEKYKEADREHGHAQSQLSLARSGLEAAKAALAPFLAEEARLAKECAVGDPRLAAANRAAKDKAFDLKIGEKEDLVTKCVLHQLVARDGAIAAAWSALNPTLAAAERAGDLGRPAQRDDLLKQAFAIMDNLGVLEELSVGHVDPFVPVPLDEVDPERLRAMIVDYRHDAGQTDTLVTELARKAVLQRSQLAVLMKLKSQVLVATLDEHIKANISSVETRLKDIDAAREAARKRARDLRAEVDRLDQRLNEIEMGIFPKPEAPPGRGEK
jgi:predicted nuclease with TOPRIM domain